MPGLSRISRRVGGSKATTSLTWVVGLPMILRSRLTTEPLPMGPSGSCQILSRLGCHLGSRSTSLSAVKTVSAE